MEKKNKEQEINNEEIGGQVMGAVLLILALKGALALFSHGKEEQVKAQVEEKEKSLISRLLEEIL